MPSISSPVTPSWPRLGGPRASWCLVTIMLVTVRVRGSAPWPGTWRSSPAPWYSTAGRRWSSIPASRSSSSATPWAASSPSWPRCLLRCPDYRVRVNTMMINENPSLSLGLVLMGPLIKPDPATASPFQQLLARVTSQVFPSLEIGELDLNLVTSDLVNYNKHLNLILYL